MLVASSVLPCPGSCLIERGVPVLSRRGYRAGRLVAMVAVACFALTHAVRLLGAVFPSSVSRRGVAWVVPVPVAAWRVHPRSPASSSQPHRFSFSVVSYRLLVRRSARRPVSSLRLGVPFPLSCPLSLSASSWGERLIHMVFSLSTRAVFLSSFSHLFPIAIVVGKHPSE